MSAAAVPGYWLAATVRARAVQVVADHLPDFGGADPDAARRIVDALAVAGLLAGDVPAPRQAEPAEAAVPVVLSATQERKLATTRIAARAERANCPRLDKAAYDPRDPHEIRLMERRRRPGMDDYVCRCGWTHLGNITPPDPPTMPDDPIVWARDRRLLALYNGEGVQVATGRAETFTDAPTMQVTLDGGRRLTWVASLTRLLDDDT